MIEDSNKSRRSYNKTYYDKHKAQLCKENYIRSLQAGRVLKPRVSTLEKYGLTLEQVQDIVKNKNKIENLI